MEKIRIIHIGDIHYPEKHNAHLVDIKDSGISPEFIEHIAPNRFDKVAQSLLREIKHSDIRSIMFSGDLTSLGDKDGYEKCVKYFLELLSKESCGQELEMHVVPGNHDLSRDRSDSSNQFDKFKDFTSIWQQNGKDILRPDEVRTTQISENGANLKLLSLNTCVGCGEVRAFPDAFKAKMSELILAADLSDKHTFDIYGEQLDTPAANEKHISIIEEAIKDASLGNYLTIILGHHGILPQSTLRIDLYTEMINGGYIRSLLNSADYPVIYCHGHIHDDPVEVLSQPRYEKSNLVSISAPEFCDGYNIIEISFSSKNTPIGCTVIPFRVTTFASVKEGDEIRIPLQKSQLVEEFCNTEVSEIYQRIPNEPVFFRDLYGKILSEGVETCDTTLAQSLSELEWVGVISLDNRRKDKSQWIVRRVGL